MPELDGVRGIAIIMVFWVHLAQNCLPPGPSTWLGWVGGALTLSWSGVDLFFVLSGYFIGGILLDQRSSPRLARTFYLRRAARILPLYYVTLAVFLVLTATHWFGQKEPLSAWIYGLFLTNIAIAFSPGWGAMPFGILWSIAVEEQFYLTAPWVVRWLPRHRVPHFLVALIAFATIARVACNFLLTKFPCLYSLTVLRMDTLAWGALVAWAVRSDAAAPIFKRLAKTWGWWAVAGALLFILLTASAVYRVSWVMPVLGFGLLAAIFTFLLVVVVTVRPPWLVRLLSVRGLVSVGRYSYFIYLWHMVIGVAVIRALGGDAFRLDSLRSFGVELAAFGATWLAGALSWRVFEGPIVRLGHRARF